MFRFEISTIYFHPVLLYVLLNTNDTAGMMRQGGDRSSTANVMCESRRDGVNFLLGVCFKNLTRSSVEESTYRKYAIILLLHFVQS
jgi:hypothetical protein